MKITLEFEFGRFSTERAHLGCFFDNPKSYFFSLNSSCATNFGPILKISVMCTPPDLGGSTEYFGSLLGSSVSEELRRESTWYFFWGTEEVCSKKTCWTRFFVI